MATTAAAADAAVPGAIPAPAPAAPSAQPHPVPDKCTNYKNHLQEWTQRNYQKLPAYDTESKGEGHRLEFRSTVEADGKLFQSACTHSRRKDAEQDAARVAYEILLEKTIDDDDHRDALGLIDQNVMFCKSILHEFAAKTKVGQPTYSADHPEGSLPMPLFVSSVLFAGNTYTGEAAISKKEAEQKAARAAVKSILATKNTCMHQIIMSKKELIIAITSSGFSKERGFESQENCNAPTNAITTVAPIKFVRAAQEAQKGLTRRLTRGNMRLT
ncbi:hypothetical protein ZWY2020_025416 [Hordeum vulgare]|nr:hypothetical protein ZWY2020_025416 [Hordeum vulgare]